MAASFCMTRSPIAWRLAAGALLCLASAAQAQYKVVGPDGRITYTDRPPVAEGATVTSMGRNAAAAASGPAASLALLPFELRQTATRYPVTLYASAECGPACDGGRQLLQQRGVPFSERRITTDADLMALERLVGARRVPALTIGQQVVLGFNPLEWEAYLNAANYPRESQLPRSWAAPPVTSLTAPATPASAPAATRQPAPPPPPAPAAEPAPANPGFRF